MTITVDILDTLFFRDGKPFSMGDDTSASGLFPPLPSVLYGMIRTTYASQKNIPLQDIEEKTNNLKINSVLYKQGNDYLFPIPADVFTLKNEDKEKAYRMMLEPNGLVSSISNCPYVLKTNKDDKIENLLGKAFFTDDDIIDYGNNHDELSFTRLEELIVREPKIGIGRDHHTLLTKEGMFYRVEMIRPELKNKKKLSIIIDFDGLELDNQGFLKIGAEGKIASYSKGETFTIPKPVESTLLKIYIATPAIFSSGSIPKFISDSNDIKLISAIIGKPIFAGGFDIKKRKPKAMKKAVPPGSIYYIETKNPKKIISDYHGKCLSEYHSKEGFGLAYIFPFKK